MTVVIQVMDRAADKIQARWRGVACRMGLARKATDDALGKRRTVSAVTIQAAARRRAAIGRCGACQDFFGHSQSISHRWTDH